MPTTSDNMGMPIPTPSVDPGPTWAQNYNACLTIIDGHNHSAGSGVPIQPNGLDISTDLSFGSNNATNMRSVRFTVQASALSGGSDLSCIYAAGTGGDLYFNDGAGNQIQITMGGAVNATSSGISSGTATASFSGGVLVVDSDTNTPGNIQCGSVLLGNNTAGSKFSTLSPPAALAANQTITLPVVPGATAIVTMDNAGNLGVSTPLTNPNFPGKTLQEGSQNVVVSNTNATTSLAIIRGSVNSGGTKTAGEGFTSSVVSGGHYVLSWSTSFASQPTLVVTLFTGASTAITVSTGFNGSLPSTDAMDVFLSSAANFSFIAIGPRA